MIVLEADRRAGVMTLHGALFEVPSPLRQALPSPRRRCMRVPRAVKMNLALTFGPRVPFRIKAVEGERRTPVAIALNL